MPKQTNDSGATGASGWWAWPKFRFQPGDRVEVVELTALLPRTAELISVVNSNECGDQDRERLRELVPASTYFRLLLDLTDLRSEFARRSRRAARQLNRLTIDLRTFFEDYKASDGTGRP